jgi:hypothetical protein
MAGWTEEPGLATPRGRRSEHVADSNDDSNKAANGKRKRSAASSYAHPLLHGLGYVRPEKRNVDGSRHRTQRRELMPLACH